MSIATPPSTLQAPLLSALQSQKHLSPTTAWLAAFLSSQRPATPLPALVSSATFRLLASDITTTLSAGQPPVSFPEDICSPAVAVRKLPATIVVQVLDVEDIGKSRWSQIEAVEAAERGERMRGREIVRVAVDLDDDGTVQQPASAGPHKLLLQDVRGTKVYAMELRDIQGLSVKTAIGSKLLLKNVTVARGMILLEPTTVTFIGGKIESLDRAWREQKKTRLRAAIEQHQMC